MQMTADRQVSLHSPSERQNPVEVRMQMTADRQCQALGAIDALLLLEPVDWILPLAYH